ncbi:DarT ssDNA thymidine ADP-ribosyltransferase family protein [Salinibacter ruber]|uniref:DarT ssDNA thymidine ADP-ribosyltransferase family protein n=1 Tax=Salinibacter ruber TaxID=146919 RepID=UPI002074A850|nr:DarT ssDNA thymidine ADP-ribosyltransferase family protein [Salinibacter ruber]
MEERPDADEMSKALRKFHTNASPASDWWLKYAFHYTDVKNAAGIIESGHLYSRARVLEREMMDTDNANPSVIDQSEHSHDWARLYFRPKTPTQYRNEGIKPCSEHDRGHCPIPVFFFFDKECIIRCKGVKFSNQGLNKARPPRLYSSPSALTGDDMPAREIYSHGYYDKQRNPQIKDRRHAEIVQSDSFKLVHCLKGIACRSVAEKETLMTLLKRRSVGGRTINKYEPIIRTISSGDLFYKDWPFVESLVVDNSPRSRSGETTKLKFECWPNSRKRCSYKYRLNVKSLNNNENYVAEGEFSHYESNMIIFEVEEGIRDMEISLKLDGQLAFAGERSVRQVYH